MNISNFEKRLRDKLEDCAQFHLLHSGDPVVKGCREPEKLFINSYCVYLNPKVLGSHPFF